MVRIAPGERSGIKPFQARPRRLWSWRHQEQRRNMKTIIYLSIRDSEIEFYTAKLPKCRQREQQPSTVKET